MIVGDSFAEHFENTYLEMVCNNLNFNMICHMAQPGYSQYQIYKNFMDQLHLEPEVVICVNTSHDRLFHPSYQLTVFPNGDVRIPRATRDQILLDTEEAARQYYKFLHQQKFSAEIYRLMVKEMQHICKERNIRLINLNGFFNYLKDADKFYGYWTDFRLLDLSRADDPTWQPKTPDTRINHFSPQEHVNLANRITNDVREYICS